MRREQTYWIAIAAVAAALVCLYAFWVGPVRVRVRQEHDALIARENLLVLLAPAVAGLPTKKAVDERLAYGKWLGEELESKVKPFFAALGGNLNAPLPTGDGTPADTPQKFKAAYQTRLGEVRDELQKAVPDLKLPADAFTRYGWVEGAALPDPKDFKQITFDFNLRSALLHVLGECRVMQINKVFIDQKVIQKEEGFGRAIPVSLTLTVAPERVTDALQGLLSAADGRRNDALAIFIQSMEVRGPGKSGSPSPAGVTLNLKLEVMDFPNGAGEKTGAAPKASAPGRQDS